MSKFTLLLNYLMILVLVGCNNFFSNDPNSTTIKSDSIQVIKLLQEVYKWREKRQNIMDFDVIVKDSYQIGVDTIRLKKCIKDLKSTNYFDDEFVKNYERIGQTTDKELRKDKIKYLNGINFSFQDADPWTYFQFDPGSYWDNFKISEFNINSDSASLKWTISEIDYKYLVRFKKVSNTWRISYMEGFDYDKIFTK